MVGLRKKDSNCQMELSILDSNVLEVLASEFREARNNYSLEELAKVFDCSLDQVKRWEKGDGPIPHTVLTNLQTLKTATRPYKGLCAFTFVDLFAGIGGIRLGFESVGGKCVFTSEWDSFAQQTYNANFGEDHQIYGDITQISEDQIPDHDVLLAGFPCQPFSLAGVSKKNALGRPHGFACATQGTLFFDVARIIAAKRPAAFLLENVKNLLSHDKGNTFKVIQATLREELGYHIFFKVLDGAHFVPQHRERIIIVGFRESVPFDWDSIPLGLQGMHRKPILGDILHPQNGSEVDLDEGRFTQPCGKVLKKYILTNNLWNYLQTYADKHRAKGNGFGFGLVKADQTTRTLSARYYKDGSEILIDRGPRKNPRRLTPRECARLMGYPETFRIPVSDTRAYKQFGNSVVVPLIAHVGKLMAPWVMAIKSCAASDRDSVCTG